MGTEHADLPKQRLYRARGAEIIRLRVAKGWDTAILAARSRRSLETINRLETNHSAYFETIREVAAALGVPMSAIATAEPQTSHPVAERSPNSNVVITITIAVPIDRFDEIKELSEVLAELKRRCDLSSEFEPKDVRGGSVVIEFEGTPGDAQRLLDAYANGELADLKVTSVVVTNAAGEAPKPRRRANYSLALAAASLLCGLSGVLPIYAPPFYAAGLITAAVAVRSAWTRRAGGRVRYVLPAIGLVLNAAGVVVWPWAVGVFRTDAGTRFQLGNRRAAATPEPLLPYGEVYVSMNRDIGPNRQRLTVIVDGEVSPYSHDLNHDKQPYAVPTPGYHSIELRIDNRRVFSDTVYVRHSGWTQGSRLVPGGPGRSTRIIISDGPFQFLRQTNYGGVWLVTDKEMSDEYYAGIDCIVDNERSPLRRYRAGAPGPDIAAAPGLHHIELERSGVSLFKGDVLVTKAWLASEGAAVIRVSAQ